MAGDGLFSWRVWSNLQGQLQIGSPRSSWGSKSPEIDLPRSFRKLNDHVYEVYKPSEGRRPSVEVAFFHGLQLGNNFSDSHIKTWLAKGKTTLWLTWISEILPDVRILTVSYDASRERTRTRGRSDMFVTCENLITCLTDGEAALGKDGCPVILVGHCLGGLVMKEVLVKADSMLGGNTPSNLDHIRNFLASVKAVFFYATPHHGSKLPNTATGLKKGPLFKNLVPLNSDTERKNEDFRKLRQAHGWISVGVGENQPVNLGIFTDLIVTEASARCDVDEYYTIDSTHFDVCRPESTLSASFQRLFALIGRVLEEDQKKLYSSVGLRTQLVGLKVPLDNIERKLFVDGRWVTQRLGIVGIGGIGKTTLAETLFARIADRFEYACFVREIKKRMDGWESSDQLHKIIVENLTRRGRLVDHNFHWSSLRGKHVLMVLDDVENEFHTKVMTEMDSFSLASVVIVTSRNKRFLIREGFTFYDMETLDHQSSKMLISLHAFRKEVAPVDFEGHVTKLADQCGGLPLALEVAGGYLYDQDKAIWDDVCKMLSEVYSISGSNVEEDRLWSILKRSYQTLGNIEQQMFLDIATCLEGEYAVDVKTMWEFRDWQGVNAALQNLVDRSLVKFKEPPSKRIHGKLSYVQAMRISMHELLRILGRDTAFPKSVNSRDHKRLVEVSKANELLNEEKPAVEIMKLKLPEYPSFDMRVLHRLVDLRVLWISSAQPTKITVFEDSFFERPSSLLLMTLSSIWKSVYTLSQQFLPRKMFPSQLAFVRIFEADTLKLQEICKIQALRCLILESPDPTVEQLPRSLCQLRQLEHLEIISCFSLKAIPAEIGSLQKLRFFSLYHCDSLEALPRSIKDLKSLAIFNVHRCSQLVVPVACLRNLPALIDLNFRTCAVENWYELTITGGGFDGFLMYLNNMTFRDLQYVKSAHGLGVHIWDEGLRTSSYLSESGAPFESCEQIRRLKRLEIKFLFGEAANFDLACFQALEELVVHGDVRQECRLLTTVKNLPGSIGSLQKLRFLEIHALFHLATLPDTLGQLQSLETLIVRGCRRLKYFPESTGQLVALQKLKVVNCKTLTTLPNSIGKLRALKILIIKDCSSMKDLPESVWQLTALQKLAITQCKSLKTVTSTAWNLQTLGEVQIDIHDQAHPSSRSFLKIVGDRLLHVLHRLAWSTEATHFSTELLNGAIARRLPTLGTLKISDFSLQRLPHTLGHLQSLAQLTVRCESVVDLEPVWQLRDLEGLKIAYCRLVVDLEPLIHFQALRQLELIDLDILTLPTGMDHLATLKHLTIQDCGCLKEIPESVGRLAALEHLEIHGCGTLVDLPDSIGQLEALKTLIVRYCYRLAKLPESLHALCFLEHLEISICQALVNLPVCIGELRALKTLTVRSCYNLTKLPDSLNQLGLLTHLEVANCGVSLKLPQSVGRLQNLECLVIENIEGLETLPAFIGQLPALKILRIKWCDNLVMLPQFIQQLGALQLLEISSCSNIASLPESFGQLPRLVIDDCICLEAWRPTFRQVDRLQQLEFRTYGLYSTLKGNEDERYTTTVFYPRDLQHITKEKKSLCEFATTICVSDHVIQNLNCENYDPDTS